MPDYNPFTGYQGASSGATPFPDINRKDALARMLLQQESPGMTSAPGAMGHVIQQALAGYLMGQNNQDVASRQAGVQDTMARALQAGQGGGNTFDSTAPQTGEEGAGWTANAKADPGLMAKVLASNPDTAGQGMKFALDNANAERGYANQAKLQEAGFGQQKSLQESSQAQQRQTQESQQQFQERMARESQAFQRSMGTPIMVPDSTSPTGFKYVRPENAVDQPAYNPNALFAPVGANGAGAPGTPALSGDDYLKTLSPQAAETVKGLAEGRIPVSPMMVRTPQGMQLLAAASQYDPTFDASNYQARAAQRKNYQGGGKQYQELQAIGTVAGHLGNLQQSAEALNNSNYPMWNSIANSAAQATGDPRVDKFNTDLQAVTNELSKAYRGGHVTEGDVKNWQGNLNAAKSPAQFRGVIGDLNDLLASKRKTLEEGYKQTMGKAQLPQEFSADNDRTKGIFDNIAKWAHGETAGQAPAAPSIDPNAALAELRRRGVTVPGQ